MILMIYEGIFIHRNIYASNIYSMLNYLKKEFVVNTNDS